MDNTADQLIARLRAQPDDAAAFSALRTHYHQIGDFASLANLIEGWASRHTDAAAAATALTEAGELVHRYLGDQRRAAALYEQALGRRPSHDDAAVRLEALLQEANDPARLAAMLERRGLALAQTGADARVLARIHLKTGQVWHQALGRPDKAVGFYRKAFEADPSLVPAIYGAREVYKAAGNLKAAASLYEMEARAEPDPTRRVALLRELAQLRADSLSDLDGGLAALEVALTQAPGDLSVLHETATLLLRRAQSARDPRSAEGDRRRAADALYQMAQVVPAEHGVAYCEAALDAVPGHDGALELLERLAESEGRPELLPLRWVGYLSTAGDAEGADERRWKLGEAYLAAGQVEDAIVCFEPLLGRGDARAAEALIALYREVGRDADVPAALEVVAAALPPEQRLPRLEEMVAALAADGRLDEAAARAREILALAPADAEALARVEAELAKAEDFVGMRALWLNATRDPNATPSAQKDWLARAARVSEAQLDDAATALGCWRAAAELDPGDAGIRNSLARALERAEAWDELVALLEGEALATANPEAKVAVQRRLADIHTTRRGDLDSAIAALRVARDLAPNEDAVSDALLDAFLAAGYDADAMPLLRARIDRAPGAAERAPLLRLLAHRLEEALGDDEGSYQACTRLLDDDPGDLETLDRMERIDVRGEQWDRLLTTLAYRADVTPEPQRAAVLARMGEIADQELSDLDRAAEYFANALDLMPDDGLVLDNLCDVYDRAGRYRDLVTLLRGRAELEQNPQLKAELYRRIARTLKERVVSDDGAAEAWTRVLEAGEDVEALRALEAHASREGHDEEQAELLGRLAAIVDEADERRSLMLQRAGILAELLGDHAEAMIVLRNLLDTVAPTHVPAMHELGRIAEAANDRATVAEALERELAVTEDAGLRLPIAQRLADLYEGELADPAKAARALAAWSDADPESVPCLERRRAVLEDLERWPELRQTLDGLAHLSPDPAVAADYTRQAATLSAHRLDDFEGAWGRLSPAVREDDAEAGALLRTLCEQAQQGERIADLYVRMAQATNDPDAQKRRWRDASNVYASVLKDAHRGLEAMLRALALDLGDEEILSAVEDLVETQAAWPRLAQVYEKIVKAAEGPEAKAALLMRHATLLDERAGDASEALDRVLRAASLVPNDDRALARAEELAVRAERGDELLYVYDRRKQSADSDEARLDAILRAVRLLDDKLLDRERAMTYVAQGIALATRADELFDEVERTARGMDQAHPEHGERAALNGLVGLYRRLAESAGESPSEASLLLARAATILEAELGEVSQAYSCLKRATTLLSNDATTLDELTRLAGETARLDELAAHLGHLVDEALDSATATALLARRGQLLEEELGRLDEAAEVYRQLRLLNKDDPEASTRLRSCLHRAGKHQDLLLVLDQELARTRDLDQRLELEREVARTWDSELDNRWEAIDAWQRVLTLAPEDTEAKEALERRGQQGTRKLSTSELGVLDEVVETSDERSLEQLYPSKASTQPRTPTSRPEAAFDADDADDVDSPEESGEHDTGEGDLRALDAAAPLDGAPIDGAPIDGAPIDGAPIDGAPIDGAPNDGAPNDGTSDSDGRDELETGEIEASGADQGAFAGAPLAESGPSAPAEFDDETDTGNLEDFALPMPSGAPPAAQVAGDVDDMESLNPLTTGEIETLTTGELAAVSGDELSELPSDQGVSVLASFAHEDESSEDLLEISGLVELPSDADFGARDADDETMDVDEMDVDEMDVDELDVDELDAEVLDASPPRSVPPPPPRALAPPPPPRASVPPPPPGGSVAPGKGSIPPPPPRGNRS